MFNGTPPPAPKPRRKLTGTGPLAAPESVQRFLLRADKLGPEEDWLKIGRPLWTIRYTVSGVAGGGLPAYARTTVPACKELAVCCVCPANTVMIEAGICLDGKEMFVPVSYELLMDEEEGIRKLRGIGKTVGRWLYWDYGGDPQTHQRYAEPGTGDPKAEPQYAGDVPPPTRQTRKKGGRKPKPAADAACAACAGKGCSACAHTRPDTDEPQPQTEDDQCQTSSNPNPEASTTSSAPSPDDTSPNASGPHMEGPQ